MLTKNTIYSTGLVLLTMARLAYAGDELSGLFTDAKFSGTLRAYQFTRAFENNATSDTHAFALGGKLKAETGDFHGFSAGLGYYFANDLNLSNHDDNNSHLTTILMGEGHTLSTVGEAYLQYKNDLLLLKAGRQTMDTPWINAGDATLIPNLYQGYTATITPYEGLKIEADRILAFKHRTTSGFDRDTVLATPNSKPAVTEDTDGAIALGVSYKNASVSAKAWLYRFYDYANLGYLQAGYTFPAIHSVQPFAEVQYMKETDSGAALAGAVDSQAYGAKIGLLLPDKLGSVFIAYNKVPHNNEAGVTNGNLVSPYTQGYVTDPLYTSGLNYGLVTARAAGEAWQLGMKLSLCNQKLDIIPAFTSFHTEPYAANIQTYLVDVAYHFSDKLNGLTLRNRLGVNHGNPQWGDYTIDNRVMVSYAF